MLFLCWQLRCDFHVIRGGDALKLVSSLLVVSYNLPILPQASHTNLLSLLRFLCNRMALHPSRPQNYPNIYGGKDLPLSKLLNLSFTRKSWRRVGGTKLRLCPALCGHVFLSPWPKKVASHLITGTATPLRSRALIITAGRRLAQRSLLALVAQLAFLSDPLCCTGEVELVLPAPGIGPLPAL